MKSLLVEHVSKNFDGIHALDNCTFHVGEGEILGLIGPNGSGKTTMFNVITGLHKADSGRISYKGENITHWKTYDIAKLGIARTFQLIRLFPKLTVMDNMLLATRYVHGERFSTQFLRRAHMKEEEKNNISRAKELLKLANLHEKSFELAENLSYGQQKLLEIVRTLATEPQLLLLDEPIAGVNPTMAKQILELIKTLNKKGMTIIVIEHNMNIIMKICSRIVVMDYGKEIAAGAPAQIKSNKKVIEAYLGKKR